MLIDLGSIRITYDANEGYRLVVDLTSDCGESNRYEGLEGSGETFKEALEELTTSVELIDER